MNKSLTNVKAMTFDVFGTVVDWSLTNFSFHYITEIQTKEELTNRIAKALADEANGDFEVAKNAAIEGINDVEKLLINHTEAV